MENSRVETIISRLLKRFTTTIELNYSTPWELLVAVVLSAQCTDKRVNIVTSSLFKKYGKVEDYANASLVEFQNDIRSIGFFDVKAKYILKSARILLDKFNGIIPNTMAELITLPGVGRKSANVLLSAIYHKNEGVIVDTHVKRLAQRLRLVSISDIGGHDTVFVKIQNEKVLDFVRDADPEKIEQILMKIVPREMWDTFSHLIVKLGRYVCKAQGPLCGECPLADMCPTRR